MIERILEIMKAKGMSPSQFADEIGIQRSGMSHLISGRNKPSLEFILKVLNRFPEIKADYLLYGNTESTLEMPPPSNVEKPVPIVEKSVQASTSPSLFDHLEINNTTDSEKQIKTAQKERNEKKIEKIVFFYSDRSFKEFRPE